MLPGTIVTLVHGQPVVVVIFLNPGWQVIRLGQDRSDIYPTFIEAARAFRTGAITWEK